MSSSCIRALCPSLTQLPLSPHSTGTHFPSSTPQWPAELLTSWRTNPPLVKTPAGVDWPACARTARPVPSPRDPETLWRALATSLLPAIRLQRSRPCPWSRTRRVRSQLPMPRAGGKRERGRSRGRDERAGTRSTGDGGEARVLVKVALTGRRREGTSPGARGGPRNPAPRSRRSDTTAAPCLVERARSFPGATGALLQIKPTVGHQAQNDGDGRRTMTKYRPQFPPIPHLTQDAVLTTVTIIAGTSTARHLLVAMVTPHTVTALPTQRITPDDLLLLRGFLIITPSRLPTSDIVDLHHLRRRRDEDLAPLVGEEGVATLLPHLAVGSAE